MSRSNDERGRIYLPKAIRERLGDQNRIVDLSGHVAFFPVDEDPSKASRSRVLELRRYADAGDLKRWRFGYRDRTGRSASAW